MAPISTTAPARAAASAADLDGLAALVARHAREDGLFQTAIEGLQFFRSSQPSELCFAVYRPSLALLVQGAKRVEVGEDVYEYNASHYLLTSIDLPVASRITLASPGTPYLCFLLDLDPRGVADLLLETRLPPPVDAAPGRALSVARLDAPLLDAALRLARLLDVPDDIAVLAPLVRREIVYRLLTGELGGRLRHIARDEGPAHQVRQAIEWLKAHFDRPLRIEQLAQSVNMSTSSLHHHFKAVTAMSPLQYQKQLRLQEARRLLLAGLADAGTAARQVGYESASQFSREYSRQYGAPPLRDVARLRGGAAPLALAGGA
ncbi:AraC family transcriptional regulator [Bordetella petrii]|uniref:AraC family transcriptional regulator n=1 Tax=Bordetella petrii TaxID=94624 RepID=A0ABT7W8Q8_9BORD|nr:AraC family transcriptional regulator [Bordetella petrii]MDM9561580.1 AraC family transcriptional regulator [Bordetella petrii]